MKMVHDINPKFVGGVYFYTWEDIPDDIEDMKKYLKDKYSSELWVYDSDYCDIDTYYFKLEDGRIFRMYHNIYWSTRKRQYDDVEDEYSYLKNTFEIEKVTEPKEAKHLPDTYRDWIIK